MTVTTAGRGRIVTVHRLILGPAAVMLAAFLSLGACSGTSSIGDGGGRSFCGRPQASGPGVIKVGSMSTVRVPAVDSLFVLALGPTCGTPARVVRTRGLRSIHRYQGSTSAYSVVLARRTAVMRVVVDGVHRTITLRASSS